MKPLRIRHIVSSIKRDQDAIDLIELLLKGGYSRNEVISVVAEFLDEKVDFVAVVPGPAGATLEIVDGPLFRAALMLVVPAIQRGIEKARLKAEEIANS